MGFFDMFKGGGQSAANVESFKRDLIQSVVIFMYKSKIMDSPMLKFFNNDQGLFEAFFTSTINDIGVQQIKVAMPNMYLTVIGTHALGAGAYISKCQQYFNKPVEEFEEKDIMKIAQAFSQTDAYELALTSLGIGLNSQNKKVMDGIVLTAQETAANLAGDISNNTALLKVYAEVLYNAGVTVAYR